MKLGTVTPYLKKIQKIYELRDTHFESPDISIFYRKSENFPLPRNTDIDCILTHNFNLFWVFKNCLINMVAMLMISAKIEGIS